MNQTMQTLLALIVIAAVALPIAAARTTDSSYSQAPDGPHVDYIARPGLIGFNLVIWNYGTSPAYLIRWEIETNGVNNTRVLNGNRRGIIPFLRPKDTQFMAPFTLPQTKYVHPFGFGEVEITVRITCQNADYGETYTNNYFLNGFVLVPISHPM